jgi:hypothetical protein
MLTYFGKVVTPPPLLAKEKVLVSRRHFHFLLSVPLCQAIASIRLGIGVPA